MIRFEKLQRKRLRKRVLDSILFSKPLHPGSDYIANRKYQQHAADDQEQGRQDDADIEP